MERYYIQPIQRFSDKKITLVTGPRQCGKTTLSKMLTAKEDTLYLNYDDEADREILREKSWDRKKLQVIFDELHKMKDWKRWLKGIFDKESMPPAITVTGSARLDTYRKFGDSLAGRYFQYRVHPFDLIELSIIEKDFDPEKSFERLMNYGGFPEPYLQGSEEFYNRWKKTHTDIILRQDLIDTEDVRNIKSIEILISLLQQRVGSPISYSSLARDLQVSDKTVKRWLNILEDLYVVFKITPFHKNLARANTKQPKYYFYDNARITASEGAKLENLVATTLFKYCHYQQDCLGKEVELFYLSKQGGIEIDFAISVEEKVKTAIEVKLSDDQVSKSFNAFAKDMPDTNFVQIVKNLKREKMYPNGFEVRELVPWLLSFMAP